MLNAQLCCPAPTAATLLLMRLHALFLSDSLYPLPLFTKYKRLENELRTKDTSYCGFFTPSDCIRSVGANSVLFFLQIFPFPLGSEFSFPERWDPAFSPSAGLSPFLLRVCVCPVFLLLLSTWGWSTPTLLVNFA